MTLVELGLRIRGFRMMRHLTQAALAAVMNVTRQAISRWEKGRSSLPVCRVPDLCRVLAISPNELFDIRVPVARSFATLNMKHRVQHLIHALR